VGGWFPPPHPPPPTLVVSLKLQRLTQRTFD
jgi:hypothetical protein